LLPVRRRTEKKKKKKVTREIASVVIELRVRVARCSNESSGNTGDTGIVKRRREEPGHTGHRWEPDTLYAVQVSKLARYFKTPSSVLPKAGKGVGR